MRAPPAALTLVTLGVLEGLFLRGVEARHVRFGHAIGMLLLPVIPILAWRRARAGAPPALDPAPWRRMDAGLCAAILAASVAIRVVGIGRFPFGLFVDEELMSKGALGALAHPSLLLPWRTIPLKPWQPGWVEMPAPYFAWPAALFALFGVGFVPIRLVSLVPGCLAPPALYCFIRSFAGRSEAAFAGFLLAGSSWHAGVSRWGWIEVMSTLGLLCAYHAIAAGRPLLAAALLAADLYLYEALRIPVLFGLGLVLVGGGGRAPALPAATRPAKGRWRALALFLLLAAPALVPFLARPQLLVVRAREVSVARDMAERASALPLAQNVVRYLLMFHQTADPNPRHHAPGAPLLDPVAGALLLVGVGGALGARRRFPALVLGSGLFASLLPGILTRLADAPHAFRTGSAAPFACALAGIGGGMLARESRLLAALAVLASFGWGTCLLESRWPRAMPPQPPCGQGAQLLAAELARAAIARGETVTVDPLLHRATWELCVGSEPANRPAAVTLADPYRVHELSCDSRQILRDPDGRPLLFVGRGCRERQPPAPRIDETLCPSFPCARTFEASLAVPRAGSYGFETFSDDGSSVAIDGIRVVDNRGESLGRWRRGEVDLAPGRHALSVTYSFLRGEPRLRLFWHPPQSDWEPIPPEALAAP